MKREKNAYWYTTIPNVLVIGWCVWEIEILKARLNEQHSAPNVIRASATQTEDLPTNIEPRLSQLEAVVPSPGLFMASVQQHFAKLYFAGGSKNWELANFEWVELQENLETVGKLLPEENGVEIAKVIEAFTDTQLAALKDSIAVKDSALFREAYQETLAMCNACHESTGRPFIMITEPTQPPVPNQRWTPRDGSRLSSIDATKTQ